MIKLIQRFKIEVLSLRFAKFFVSGVTAFLVDTAVLNLFALVILKDEMLFLGIIYPSKFIAASVGVTVSFLLNRYWTFEANEEKINGQATKMIIAFLFNLIYTSILYTIYFALVEIQPILKNENLYPTIANVLTIGTAMFINFFIYKYFVFRGGRNKQAKLNQSTP